MGTEEQIKTPQVPPQNAVKEYVIMAKIDTLGNFSYHLPDEVDKACLLLNALQSKVITGLNDIFKPKEPPKPKIDLVTGIKQNYNKIFGGK